MNNLLNEVKRCEDNELERCRKQNAPFVSAHEGYAVLLEEFEESVDEIKAGKKILKGVWESIKMEDEDFLVGADHLEQIMLNAAAEAIQTATMCRKLILSRGEEPIE